MYGFRINSEGSSNILKFQGAAFAVVKDILTLTRDTGRVGIGTNSPSEKLHVTGNARVTGAYYDSNNSPGTSGQILSSTVTGTDWVSGSGLPGGPYLPLAGGTMTGTAGVIFPDSFKLNLGTGSDLEIFHDGADSIINNNLGHLYITQKADDRDIIFRSDDGSGGVTTYFQLDGSQTQTVFYQNAQFQTNARLKLGNSGNLQMYHTSGISFIENNTGPLYIKNNANDQDIILQSDNGSGGVENYIQIDGSEGRTLFNKTIRLNDAAILQIGNDADLRLYHNGTNSNIENFTGTLQIIQNLDDGDISFKSDNGSGGTTEYFRLDGGSTMNVFSKPTWQGDGVKSFYGNSQDLQIYHDGSNSYVSDTGTGSLILTGTDLQLKSAGDEFFMYGAADGQVALYHNGTKKFETGGTGVTVIGSATATTFLGDLNGTINTATTAVTKANATNDTTVATTAFVQNLIGTIPAGLVFQGTWNAATNTPTLTSGSGTTGHFYIVSTDGSTNLDGITDWKVGDWAVFVEQGASDQWEKVDNSSVLDGSGTGGSVAGWAGSGTSNTLTNAPITFSGNNTTFAGNVKLGDSNKLLLGASQDLQMYHNSADSYIENYTGNLTFRQRQDDGDIIFESDDGSGGTATYFRVDGDAVETRFLKSTLHFDNVKAKFGDSGDLQIYHDGSNSFMVDAGIGDMLHYYSNDWKVIKYGTGELSIWATTDAGVKLYYDSVKKFETGSTGVTVAGNISFGDSHFIGDDADDNLLIQGSANENIIIDSADDLILDAGGNDIRFKVNSVEYGKFKNDSSDFAIFSSIQDKDILFKGNDGGSTITALALDMSEGGNATFAGSVTGGAGTFTGTLTLGTTTGSNINMLRTSANYINATNATGYLVFRTGGFDTALTLTASQNANFAGDINIGTGKSIYFSSTTGLRLVHDGSNGNVINSTGDLKITNGATDKDIIFRIKDGASSLEAMRVDGSSNQVGIGTTSPVCKLDVNGGARAGGVITYSKSSASLDATGYAVAGLTTGFNGNSTGFTFTCFGNTGGYQKIVYSCYNGAGTWYSKKVIDEGTNDFDVEASANGSTITFTFKSTSGTKNYTPRVTIEATGHSINSTYA